MMLTLTVRDIVVMCLSAALLGGLLALAIAWTWLTGDIRRRSRRLADTLLGGGAGVKL